MSYTNALFTAQVSHSRQSNLSFLTPQNSTTQYQQLHAHYKNASPSSTHQTAPLSIEQYAQQISGKSPFGTLVAARTTPHTRQVTIQRSPRCPNCSSIPPSSSSWSSLNIAHLPRDIDDCHVMIQSLRSQLVQSRGRAAALEDELSSYRDQSLALQLNSSTPLSSLASTVIVPTKTPLSPAPLKSSPKQLHENFGDVLTAMQRRVDEQSLEIQRLVEEKTDLKRAANEAAIEASLKLEAERTLLLDERIRYEKNQQELAVKLGKEAALTAFAAASAATLKQDQEKPNIAHSLTTLEETKAYSINNNIGESTADHEGLETNKVQSKMNDQDDTIEGPLIPSAVSPKALSANELLVRHEHIRQQEMLILALKQQQQQTKALVLAQQRQQAMLDVHGITLGSSYGSGSSYASKSFENGIRGGFSNEEVYSEEPSSYRVPPIHPIQHQAQLRLQAATNKMLYTIAADQNQFNHHHQQQQQIIQQNEVSPSSISSSLTSSISNGGGQYGFNDRRLQSANIKNGLVEQSVNEGKSSRLRTRDSSDLPLDDKHIQPYQQQQQQQQQYVTPEQQQRIQIMQQQMNQRAAAASASASGTGNNTLVSNQQTTVSSTATNELVAISAPQSSSSSTVRTRQPATASSVSKNTANTTDFATNEVAEQRMQKAILMPSSPLAGIIPSRLFKFANVVELNEDLVSISLISGCIGLPPGQQLYGVKQ